MGRFCQGRSNRLLLVSPRRAPNFKLVWGMGRGYYSLPSPPLPAPSPTQPPTTTSITSLNLATSSSVCCQSVLTTDPPPSNFTVSTHLNRRSLNASEYAWVSRRDPIFLVLCLQWFFFLPVLVLCTVEWFTRFSKKGDESFLVFKCLAFHYFADPVLIAGPFSSQLVPDAPSIVPAPLMFSTLCGCTGHFSFRMLCKRALLAKVPNSSLGEVQGILLRTDPHGR